MGNKVPLRSSATMVPRRLVKRASTQKDISVIPLRVPPEGRRGFAAVPWKKLATAIRHWSRVKTIPIWRPCCHLGFSAAKILES
jgi:hypothetical protein